MLRLCLSLYLFVDSIDCGTNVALQSYVTINMASFHSAVII